MGSVLEIKECKNCQAKFDISQEDKTFYDKIEVPSPTLCPICRSQRRLSWRNESTLYKRKCDLCDKTMVTMYSPEKPYPVYCQDCFWSDKWDELEHGQELNFNEPFFTQFDKLIQKSPRLGIINKQSQNSEYCNYSLGNKNCYLTFGNHYEEDDMYGRYSTKNKNCMDYQWVYESELSYEITFSNNCYKSIYLDHCEQCDECLFGVDLKGCKNCLMCAGLRHKEYHIYNKPYSKEEYFKILESLNLGSYKNFQKGIQLFIKKVRETFPMKDVYQVNSENCEGSNLTNCKDMRNCFDASDCESCAHSNQLDNTHFSMDMTCMGYDKCELCYECVGDTAVYDMLSTQACWHSNYLKYCSNCFNCQNCFGCNCMKKKEYCILNKQYSKEEYKELTDRLINYMKETEEYGEFFPTSISPFGYNETVASQYYPLSKEEVLAKTCKWQEEDKSEYKPSNYEIPEEIKNVSENITDEILSCEGCKKNYKIIQQELKFYKNLNIPVPRKCFRCRIMERNKLMPTRKLFDRKCDNCTKNIKTAYDEKRNEKVFCESCYLETVK